MTIRYLLSALMRVSRRLVTMADDVCHGRDKRYARPGGPWPAQIV